jgi:zinc protease
VNWFIHFILGVLSVLLVGGPVRAAEASAEPKKVRSVEGVTEYTLPNGLRILLYPDESTPKVTVNLTVLGGSRHEGYGETGMAHLLEHMLFKGTPTHRNIPKLLNEHGADYNATTSYDRTNFFETMRASDKNLEFALRLEADRFVNSLIRREDLATEMTVVRSEFEAGENNPMQILNQRMWAAAFEWHNYGKNTIGNRSDIERVPIESLQAFYKKHYRPDNAVLIVGGNFKEKTALEMITKYFGPIKKPAQPMDSTYTEEPAQDGERNVVLRRVGDVGVAGVAYHIPASSHEDYPALDVLGQMLLNEPTGRLYKSLVVDKKASKVTGGANGLYDPSLLEFMAIVGPEQSIEAARDAMLDVLEKLHEQKLTLDEVLRAKRKLLKDYKLVLNDCGKVVEYLSEWTAQGDWRLFFLHRDRLAEVKVEDVARVAQRYLKKNNRTVGLYIPTKEPQRASVPARPDIDDLVKDYKGGKAIAAGEPFDPTPENIEKRTKRGQLPSGVKTALLSKKTRAEAVTGVLTLRYGNADSLKGQNATANLLPSLLSRGTKKHTREQIEDALDHLDAVISAGGGPGYLRFDIDCKRENLPAAVKLLGEMLREPTFPAEEFDVIKAELLDRYKQALTNPNTLASVALRRKLGPYDKDDVRYVPTIEEGIARNETVTLDQVRQLYNEQIGGQTGELALVGDFDAEPTLRQFEEILGGWKTKTPYQRIASPAQEGIKGERVVINTPDKENAVYVSGLGFGLKDSDPEYPALLVADFVFGSSPLSSRLAERVRQQEGLSYSVGSSFSAGSLDRNAKFMMDAICNPINIDKVDKALTEELQRFLKDGVDPKELEEGKGAYLQQLRTERGSDSTLASQLSDSLHEGRTFAFQAELEKQIADLTVDKVNTAFRKFLDPKKLVTIRAGDFKAKPGPGKKE